MNSHYTHFQMDILKNAVTTMPKFGSEPRKRNQLMS